MIIKHRQEGKGGAFYYEQDGQQMAEMVYVMAGPDKMIIEHTEVSEALEGQGIGKHLLEELVNYVRTNKIKVIPLCVFAKSVFNRKKEWQDVLA